MAKGRKDNKGRLLHKGETQRKTDLMYIYTWTDSITHKRQYLYSMDLMKLREKEKALMRNQLDGLDVYAAGRSDLNFVFDRYISGKKELRSSTYSNYTYMYDHFVRETFGKKKICDIKYSDVLHFYLRLLEEKHIQVNTLETIHSVLNPTFALAVRDCIIRKNPCEGVMAEVKKISDKTNGIRHALTIEEQRAFMNYIVDHPVYYRWSPLFTVLLGTGCRIGEAVGLRFQDVDFEKGIIDINHAITYYPRSKKSYRCEYEVSDPKTEAGKRTIPMIPEVRNAFLEEKMMQKESGIKNTMEVDGMKGFVFCNRFGKLHNSQSVNRAIKRIIEDYNTEELLKAEREKRPPIIIPHFSCHHLRHTFCTRFCENETNVKVIQSIMGHANIQTTLDIYAEVSEMKKSESMEKLARNMKIF